MGQGVQWTPAMHEAYPYVHMYLERGLSGAEALREYRAGGGSIRTQDWYTLARELSVSKEYSGYIPRLAPWSTIPSSWASYEPLNYNREYVLKVKVTATDAFGNVWPDLHRYIESDRALTKREWWDAIRDALETDRTIPDITSFEILDTEYVRRKVV